MNAPRIVVGDSYLPLFDGRVKDRFVLVEGRRGTGKTRAILSSIVARALRWPGTKWILGRSTRANLSETVLSTLEDQVLPAFGLPVPKGSRTHRESYVLPNTSMLLPKSLDDPNRGQSSEADGAYLAEISDLQQNDALAMTASLRPHGVEIDYQQIIMCINPVEPTFWANKLAQPAPDSLRQIKTLEQYRRTLAYNAAKGPDGMFKRIITSLADNPGYFNVRSWTLTKAGSDYIAGLEWLRGFMRQRWLDGIWVAAEGAVFAGSFNETANTCTPFEVPSDWPIWFYGDPGYDHPFGCFWVTISPAGKRYIIGELYERGADIERMSQLIRGVEQSRGWNPLRRYLDPRYGFSHTIFAKQGKTIAENFLDEGMEFEAYPPLAGPSKDAGVNSVRKAFVNDKLSVFKSCVNMINELQSWSYKRNASGQSLSGDDQYVDKGNDLIDPLIGCAITPHKFEDGTPAYVEPEPWRPDADNESGDLVPA